MPTTRTDETKTPRKPAPRKKDRAAEIADTFEWLITAFILAFVFRAFVMEAFRIPTGSMAPTLMGAHFRLRCVQCGYPYEHGFIPGQFTDPRTGRALPEDTVPGAAVRPPKTRCPSCGYLLETADRFHVANGDRILVLKCIYQLFEPKRWDVVVFKNPGEPDINYIKRLVGLPGEQVQIIDGDVYINGRIARKPPKVQHELWSPIYDNDYQPVNPEPPLFNGHAWRSPFRASSSSWTIPADSPTVFKLQSPPDRIEKLVYDTSIGNDFRADYAYNSIDYSVAMPTCSDLMARAYVRWDGRPATVGILLTKYGIEYRAWLDAAGRRAVIARGPGGSERLVEQALGPQTEHVAAEPMLIRFANVDHRLVFEFGREKLVYDLGPGPDDAGPRRTGIEPRVEIFASGELTLCHVGVFRDIHYTPGRAHAGGPRASERNAFKLEADEFFVLGDNSPNSQDSRWWTGAREATKGRRPPRAGVVPRYYLVGKALFVYWPSGFKPFEKFPVALIPNVGKMRFIYGGSNDSP